MPIELGCHIMRVTQALVHALKQVVGANKVYMHTMCSGELSHLHFQLIPRRPGELIGGRVFAAERSVLTNYQATLGPARGGTRLDALSDAVGGKAGLLAEFIRSSSTGRYAIDTHHTRLDQGRDLSVGEADLAEDLVGVGARF